MREILFRGKRINNGEWVYGGIMKNFHPNFECENMVDFNNQTPNCYCICVNNKDYFVQQNTIGQYTGYKDRNGKEIFEGDIVAYTDTYSTENGIAESDCIGKIVWDEEEACFHVTERLSAESWEVLQECCVIGNIFDNPELLDEGH